MQDRKDAGQDECRTEMMQNRTDAGQKWCRTGRMQGRNDAEQDGCRAVQMYDRTDAGIFNIHLIIDGGSYKVAVSRDFLTILFH